MLLRLLRTFLLRYRRELLIVVGLTLVQVTCTLILPALIANIINKGVITGDTNYIWKTGALMLLVTFVQVMFAIAAVYFGHASRWPSAATCAVRCSTGSPTSRPRTSPTSVHRRSSPASPTT